MVLVLILITLESVLLLTIRRSLCGAFKSEKEELIDDI